MSLLEMKPVDSESQPGLFGSDVTARPTIRRDVLARALAETLRDLTLEQFAGLLTNEFEAVLEYAALCEGKKACQRTSLLFNPHRLETKTRDGATSTIGSFDDVRSFDALARLVIARRKQSRALADAIEVNTHSVYVNEFPPYKARDACHRFGLNRESKVLDPCAGWGGRMIGCSTIVDSYTAFDPSPRTVDGLLRLHAFIQRFRPEFQADVQCLPYEDSSTNARFDFAMTSPPYFDTERYEGEQTSWVRYPTFDAWVRGFYSPLILLTMQRIKPGGVFLLNIGDRAYPLSDTMKQIASGFDVRRSEVAIGSGVGLRGKADTGEKFWEIRYK